MPVAGKFEVASGAIDGVNAVFTVSTAYRPNSVAVFVNGALRRRDLADGWSETNPATGEITLAEPPTVGEVVQIFFIDASPGASNDTIEMTILVGKLVAVEDLGAKLTPVQEMSGTLTSGDP